MNEERLKGRLENAERALLLCSDRDKADQITAEIHEIKAKLYYGRRRANYHRDKHQAFQRTGAGR